MRRIHTAEAPAAVGPYAQGVIEGNFLFTAGQVALTSEGKLVKGSIEDETHQVMKNLQAILDAAGCQFANVIKTTIYTTDPDSYKAVNAVYGEYFPNGEYPARECVGVPFLPLPDAHVEISMIASFDTELAL